MYFFRQIKLLQWQVPLPLQNLLMGLPNGLFKFLVIILIAKSKEMIKLNVSLLNKIANMLNVLTLHLCIY